jgi:hypothetical protein
LFLEQLILPFLLPLLGYRVLIFIVKNGVVKKGLSESSHHLIAFWALLYFAYMLGVSYSKEDAELFSILANLIAAIPLLVSIVVRVAGFKRD